MTDLPWPSMAVVGAGLLGVLAAGEIAHRRFGVLPELSRKLDHAAAGPILIVLPAVFESPVPVVILSAGFAALIVGARVIGQLDSVHGIRRSSAGAFVYPVAIATTFAVAHERPERYAVAIAALAFADAASGFVGDRWGRATYASWGQTKSVEGSIAAFAVTALATTGILLLAGTPPWPALASAAFTGLVVALVEAALPWGLDNLGVPLAAVAAVSVATDPLSAALVLAAAVALCRVATARPRAVRGLPEPSAADS
jgi:dolichol kinase